MKPWGRWATLGLGFIALFGGQAVSLATLMWWYRLSLTRWLDLASDGVIVALSICIATVVQVTLLTFMARRTGIRAADYLGLSLPRKHDLVQGIIAAAILTAVTAGISKLLDHNLVTQFQLDIYRTASTAGWLPWLLLALVVVAPIGEETLFRGFLFRGWQRSPRDAWPVIITTALLWALLHVQYDFYLIAQVFVYGLMLGWFRWKSGSTILVIFLHGLMNFEGVAETIIAFRG